LKKWIREWLGISNDYATKEEINNHRAFIAEQIEKIQEFVLINIMQIGDRTVTISEIHKLIFTMAQRLGLPKAIIAQMFKDHGITLKDETTDETHSSKAV